nr:AraC family transcriptional regulator [uncultured Roseococcus sp.]
MPQASQLRMPLRLEEFTLRHAPDQTAKCSLQTELERRRLASPQVSGQCRRFAIRPGFDLTLYDIVMGGDLPQAGSMEPSLSITVLLDGAGQGYLYAGGRAPIEPPVTYRAGTTYFCYGTVPVIGRCDLPPGSHFLGAQLSLSLSFLEDIGMGEVFRQADATHAFHLVGAEDIWVGTAPTPEAVAHITALLVGEIWKDGDRQDLLIEKGTLDLLTATMEMMRHPPERLAWGSRDTARLRQARGLMLSDPMRAWTIAGLARQVGLNEKKLKAGFRTQFGTSVIGFLQDVRLRAAHRLLLEGRSSITEVAMAVGYANPSHFALMFRRRYGVSPSALRR